MKSKPNYSYNPNSPFFLNRSISKAEIRLEGLRLRQKIAELDEKLHTIRKLSKELYSEKPKPRS